MAAAPPLGIDLKQLQTLFAVSLALIPTLATGALHVVVVEGLGGEERYTEEFATQVAAIETASKTLTSAEQVRVFRSADASRDAVLAYFTALAASLRSDDRLLVYLVGHGSYDDHDYKFNIAGPDLTGTDIAEALTALPTGNQLLVNTSSASGAIADLLEADNRTLILATRSGVERHATRFGGYFAAALTDTEADTDKNQTITAAEAFRYAERRVGDYFDREGQLSTEHARLEGTSADRIPLARLGAVRPRPSADSELAELSARRDALNAEIDELRLARDNMEVDAYRAELLEQMLELARVEDAIEAREQELENRD